MAKKTKTDDLAKVRELYAQATRALWANENWAKKTRKAMREAQGTEEARAKLSEIRKAEWADPVIRARRTKGKLAAIKRKRREKQHADV